MDKAQEYLKKLRDYNVESAEYYYNKSVEIRQTGHLDPTLEIEEGFLSRSLAINPLFAPSLIRLSELHGQRKQYNDAINILSGAISKSVHPDFTNFIILRADINFKKNMPAIALIDYLWAYSLCPFNMAVSARIASCYFAIGQLSNAAQYASLTLEQADIQKIHDFDDKMNLIISAFNEEKARYEQMFTSQQKGGNC